MAVIYLGDMGKNYLHAVPEDEWNNDWWDELKVKAPRCYERSEECKNLPGDIFTIAKLICKYNPDIETELCLDRALQWLIDWNNQPDLYPTLDEYKELLHRLNFG